MTMIVTENRLHEWVCSHNRDAQGVIVELIYQLVAASSPNPNERRFPLPDSIGQPGPDGVLDTDIDFKPFVPGGISYWEIGGASKDAGRKATDDYSNRTRLTPDEVRKNTSFVFVTPLSGRINWQYTWNDDAQLTWMNNRKKLNEWKDVRVIDGMRLIDWLSSFPAIEQWLAIKMGIPARQMETIEQHWSNLKDIGYPFQLIPEVFLVNRKDAYDKLENVFNGDMTIIQLKLETHFPDQVTDFIAAYIENMDRDAKMDVIGRCLIISSSEAWKEITDTRERHFLIANFDLDDDAGTRLLAKARRKGHIVVYQGFPGGEPLPHPKSSFPSQSKDQSDSRSFRKIRL
jgi:hypothetical protein